MPPTYIAGYDGSEAAHAAVRFAAALGASRQARVIAVNVYPSVLGGGGFLTVPELVITAQRELAERALEAIDDPRVERMALCCDSPSRGLHDLAEREDAALLAVGATHHRGLGRLVPGSVGAHLLSGAPCPVAVVPPDTPNRPPSAIGVAYDGRPEARKALAAAAHLADDLDARLIIIGAHDPIVVTAVEAAVLPELDEEAQASLRQELEQAANELEREAEVRLVIGAPGRAITDVTPELDLLVAGSRGYGPARAVLLGSVSRHLVDHADCPVLVIPRSAAHEDAT